MSPYQQQGRKYWRQNLGHATHRSTASPLLGIPEWHCFIKDTATTLQVINPMERKFKKSPQRATASTHTISRTTSWTPSWHSANLAMRSHGFTGKWPTSGPVDRNFMSPLIAHFIEYRDSYYCHCMTIYSIYSIYSIYWGILPVAPIWGLRKAHPNTEFLFTARDWPLNKEPLVTSKSLPKFDSCDFEALKNSILPLSAPLCSYISDPPKWYGLAMIHDGNNNILVFFHGRILYEA